MSRSDWVRQLHWKLIACVMALMGIGLLTLASATSHIGPSYVTRQAMWVCIGCVVAVVTMRVGYRRFLDWAVPFYIVTMGLLIFVLGFGSTRLGATRWIDLGVFSLQPSELARIAVILALAKYYGAKPRVTRLVPGLLVPLGLMGPLVLLVLAEPDLGSAAMVGFVGLAVCFGSGAPKRWFGWLIGIGLASLPIAWEFVLKEYQKQRLLVFMNPNHDPLGAGYTVIQSRIAVGSGGLFGKGWRAGTQNQLQFLPERHTDFIFAVIAEEWGFLGSVLIVGLLFAVVLLLLKSAEQTRDPGGQLIVIGVAVWLGLQTAINIGMTMGLVPVVGLPLPFVSYGGSNLVMAMVGLGLAMDVRSRRSVF